MMAESELINICGGLRGPSLFADIDFHFASFVSRRAGGDDNIFLAAALASHATISGKHVCIDLEELSGDLNDYFRDLTGYDRESAARIRSLAARVRIPGDFRSRLEASPAVSHPGGGEALVLDGSRLYLQRYWCYEQRLGRRIRELASRPPSGTLPQPGALAGLSARFSAFAMENPGELNYQELAAFAALRNPFTVISGGPGTGKTTVVAAIIAMSLMLDPECRVALCAPTGKAQARLRQAVRDESKHLNCPDSVLERLMELEAFTVHRLLRVKYGIPHFRHNAANPLPYDLIVVDESSMVPLTLMAKLLDAVSGNAKVVLLGDKDQLASVESGAVLNDICAASGVNVFSPGFVNDFNTSSVSGCLVLPELSGGVLRDCAVGLTRNYRFAPDRGIARVKDAICALNEEPGLDSCLEIVRLIGNDRGGEIIGEDLPAFESGVLDTALHRLLRTQMGGGDTLFRNYPRAPDVASAFAIFEGFRILCSHRSGPYGVVNINKLVENALGLDGRERFYRGRPVMVLENDHKQMLFNGDIGMVWPDPSGGSLRVYFPDEGVSSGFRSFSPHQLPEHETVFAMTVHKSQGSGFRHVLVVIPDDANSPLLTRELVYTAITRAMKHVRLWFRDKSFAAALRRRTRRTSGLKEILLSGYGNNKPEHGGTS